MNTTALAGGQFSPPFSSITLPNEISVPGNLTPGSVIWKSPVIQVNLHAVYFSESDAPIILLSSIRADIRSGTKAPGYHDVYSTNVAGLGIRWWATWRANSFISGRTLPITTYRENNAGDTWWDWSDAPRPQDIWIELVKTGNITGGTLSNPAINAYLSFHCGACIRGVVNLTGTTKVVAGPSCTVANTAIPVTMGAVPTWRFTGLHSTSDPRPFDITLNCQGGEPGSAVRPHVTLTDANDSGNRSTTLTVSRAPASNGKPAATGVGIQIQKDGAPLSYGPDSSAPGNINQWSAGTLHQGVTQFRIPLTANYVQTAAQITPGTANGRATFTLSYQ